MSTPEAPMQPVELQPHQLVFLRDKSLAEITHLVDGPEPYELLGHTKAEAGRPVEPLLWRADGSYGPHAKTKHYLDIVGIDNGDRTVDGRAIFVPFTGLRFPKKKKGGQS